MLIVTQRSRERKTVILARTSAPCATMSDRRDALAHVLWIGGGPQVGKTTLSRLLAGKYDLKIYNLDWHDTHDERRRGGGRRAEFARLSMDDRWALPEPDALVERSLAIWTELFSFTVEDLLATPHARPVLAEGPGAFPWLVAPLIRSPRQAIFLVPSAAWRERVAERRYGPAQAERFGPQLRDRKRALANIRARDAIIDQRIAASCVELDLRCEAIDGSLDLDTSLALIEDHFRPGLPETYNV
jgi:hypothetical protein